MPGEVPAASGFRTTATGAEDNALVSAADTEEDMHLQRLLLTGVLVGIAGMHATGQARFHTTRPIEFHLAEDEPAPGLTPVHINGEARVIYVRPEIQLDDHDIRSAAVVRDANGQPAVQVRLRKAGVEKFNALVRGNAHKTLAIAAKDKVILAPNVEDGNMTRSQGGQSA